uniref:Peptidase M16 N-terminal domain-containing protein n=1 Tax=Chaetoceros debilis TaxID=122233 RepID=A0A7S3PZZ8_9STRA
MAKHIIVTTELPAVIKGDADWRIYRPLQLPNGVTCLLVHDKESKTTACSVSIGIGASADPRSLSGLAHFTEHMCFLGSEAYPEENAFKSYLSSHGGRSNASTSMSATTYKFDILAAHAEKVVDIFSNFFIAPLFTESGTAREVNAVDSENSKNESNDGRRRLQILKALADPTHHYSKFSTGNAKTLSVPLGTPSKDSSGDNVDEKKDDGGECINSNNDAHNASFVREALLAFHRRHYTPDNMTVAIVGPQDLDTLEDWIVPRFAKVKNNWNVKGLGKDRGNVLAQGEMSAAENFVEESAYDAPNDSFNGHSSEETDVHAMWNPAFHPGNQNGKWPVLLTTRPLQSVRKCYMYFPLPPTRSMGGQSPYSLLTHLLGHEGKGSCFAVLQDAGLVDSISAGARLSDQDQSLMQIYIALTEKGEGQWEDVVRTIFEYCRLMHQTAKLASASGCSNSNGNDSKTQSEALETLKRVWNELIAVRAINFHQTSPSNAYAFAPGVASNVRVFGTEKCISSGKLLDQTVDTLPLTHFLSFLEKLTPENCIIERCSQMAWDEKMGMVADQDSGIFGFQKEKWYGVEYHVSPIDSSVVEDWREGKKTQLSTSSDKGTPRRSDFASDTLHLPHKNRYIPQDLTLCKDLPIEAREGGPHISKQLQPPTLLRDNDFGRLWHKLDDRYCLPKSSISFLIRNGAVQSAWDDANNCWNYNSDSAMHTSLLLDSFYDGMAQETYDAGLAGLYWSLSKSSMGLTFKFSGYSQHLTDFALQMMRKFFTDQNQTSKDVDVNGNSFLCERHLATNKDRIIRHLKSYFKSKRADSYASYYTDFLLSSRGDGIDNSLRSAKAVTLDSLNEHYMLLSGMKGTHVDCLFSGNVSDMEAKRFFDGAENIMNDANQRYKKKEEPKSQKYDLGPFSRRLKPGEDIHLHFQSDNKEEQNGAVLMTFQSSSLPGFKGLKLSSKESLRQSAAIRTICHMLREPLFNQLRTKEQLGYIVSSYYNVGFSSHSAPVLESPEALDESNISTATTSIDSIVVNVLSKKVPPPILTQRIDEFLSSFRERLSNIPEDEIKSHTDALSKKLLKPKQKLYEETSMHFQKICKYSPEVFDSTKQLRTSELPWDSAKELASSIKELDRVDLMNAWDNIVSGKKRSRVVSHVYGKTFPLSLNSADLSKNIVNLKSLNDIKVKRNVLSQFSGMTESSRVSMMTRLLQRKNAAAIGLAAGAGLLLYTFLGGSGTSSDRTSNSISSRSKMTYKS